MESLSLCLPLKSNTQKHFPLVYEDATSSLCRSLRVDRAEWESSRKVLFWLSAPTQQTKQRPLLWALCSCPSSTWHLTSHTSGKKTPIPWEGINSARRIEISWEQAPRHPARCVSQAASCSHTHTRCSQCRSSIGDTYQESSGRRREPFLQLLQFTSLHLWLQELLSGAPHCAEVAKSTIQLSTFFSPLNSWPQCYTDITLFKKKIKNLSRTLQFIWDCFPP